MSQHRGGAGSQMRVETQGFSESGKTTGPGDRRVNLRVHSFLGKFSAPLGGADSSPATIEAKIQPAILEVFPRAVSSPNSPLATRPSEKAPVKRTKLLHFVSTLWTKIYQY